MLKKTLFFLIIIQSAYAADTKLSDLTALSQATMDDLVYVVDDPNGTPTSYRIGVEELIAAWPGSGSITWLGTIATGTWQGTVVDALYGGTGMTTLPVFNVKHPDYGATGDGVTDDSTAIQAAIDAAEAAGGGTVLFPSATYIITTGLTVTDWVKLLGVGLGSTLSYNTAGYAVTMNGNESTISNMEIVVGLTGSGTIRITSENAVVIRNTVDHCILRSSVADSLGSGRIGILIEGDAVGGSDYPNYYCRITNNRIDNFDTGIKTTCPSGASDGMSNGHFFGFNTIRNVYTYAYDLADESLENTIIGGFVDSSANATALHITGIRNMILGFQAEMGGASGRSYLIDATASSNWLIINNNDAAESPDNGTGNFIISPDGLSSDEDLAFNWTADTYGFGTSSPDRQMELENGFGQAIFRISGIASGTTNGDAIIELVTGTSSIHGYLGYDESEDLVKLLGGSSVNFDSDTLGLFIDASGNFGIGTKAPGTLFQIGGDGNDGALTIFSEQGATDYSVIFQPSASMTGTTTYTLPINDGDADQVLATNGSGVLSWVVASGTFTMGNLTGDVTSVSYATDIDESVLEDGGTDELAITAGMMNLGTGASSTTFWRGDNTWALPASNTAYGGSWNGNLEPPSKNAVYDVIEGLPINGNLTGDVTSVGVATDIDESVLGVGQSDTIFPAPPASDKALAYNFLAGTLDWADIADVDDIAYAATWATSTNATSKSSIYTYLINFDADADGSFTDEGWYSAGSGDITDVWSVATGNANALTAAAGDSLDATSADSTVPWRVSTTATPTIEGQTTWESDTDELTVGDGTNSIVVAAKTKSRSFAIKNIAAADDFPFWQTPRAITLTAVSAICTGGTNTIGQLQEYAGGGTTPVDCDSADWTITTSEYTDSSFTNAAIDAGDWLGWKTVSVSGTVTFMSLTFEYYEL